VAGIAIGGVAAGIAALAAIILFFIRRRKRKLAEEADGYDYDPNRFSATAYEPPMRYPEPTVPQFAVVAPAHHNSQFLPPPGSTSASHGGMSTSGSGGDMSGPYGNNSGLSTAIGTPFLNQKYVGDEPREHDDNFSSGGLWSDDTASSGPGARRISEVPGSTPNQWRISEVSGAESSYRHEMDGSHSPPPPAISLSNIRTGVRLSRYLEHEE
jgi:hypothetical protein